MSNKECPMSKSEQPSSRFTTEYSEGAEGEGGGGAFNIQQGMFNVQGGARRRERGTIPSFQYYNVPAEALKG